MGDFPRLFAYDAGYDGYRRTGQGEKKLTAEAVREVGEVMIRGQSKLGLSVIGRLSYPVGGDSPPAKL